MNNSLSHLPVAVIIVISLASMFALLPNPNPSQQQSVYASSPKTSDLKQEDKQNLDQDNLCHRSDGCEQANEGQQIEGNDNTASGFNDQSTTNTSSLSSSSGPQGQQGQAGPRGEPGTAGPTQSAVVTQRTGTATTITPGVFGSSEAPCNPGELATGGGYRFSPSGAGVTPPYFDQSSATADNLGWSISAFNPGASSTTVIAFAECLKLVP